MPLGCEFANRCRQARPLDPASTKVVQKPPGPWHRARGERSGGRPTLAYDRKKSAITSSRDESFFFAPIRLLLSCNDTIIESGSARCAITVSYTAVWLRVDRRS